MVRRRQLTALKVEQTNHAHLVREPDVAASFAAILASIAAQIRALEARIAQAIAADPRSTGASTRSRAWETARSPI